MLAFTARLFGTKAGLVAITGLILAALTGSQILLNRAYQRGAAAVRIEWAQERARQLAAAEAQRAAMQAKIDAAEQKYVEDRAGDAIRMSALEEALLAKDDLDADPAASCPRPPAVSRRVSRALNAIGR